MGANGTVARTLFIGLDACDAPTAQQFARDGDMPTLARLLDTAAVQPTIGPLGFLVGGVWPTAYTGTTPSRHQFLCSGQVRGGTYENRWLPPITDPPGVWQWVSDAGGRVAVFDAPHAAVATELNGVQLVEWGCHDRHAGTRSYPEHWLDEVNATYGAHLLGTRDVPFPHGAPCDTAHRAGVHRTAEENRALLDDLLEGHRRKAALCRDVLAQGDWDLFFAVFGESHCGGHQFWKLHDTEHPWHEPEQRRALGDDPLRVIYRTLDHTVGELIEAAGPDTQVYVLLSHGMGPHFDGTCLVEPLLWRLDEYASGHANGGGFGRALDRGLDVVPRRARERALRAFVDARRRLVGRAGPIGTDGRPIEIPQWIGQRRWWMQPNDSAYASIRLNLEGREPNGRIAAAHKRETEEWLAARVYELVNVDTAAPAVSAVYFTDDHYERVPGDPLGDLIVEWNRDAPIDTVWSPATGVITAPYGDWRTGDHHRRGLLCASAPGITPGRRSGVMSVVDLAPTLAAATGVDVPEFVEGHARADLLPAGTPGVRPSTLLERPGLGDAPAVPSSRRRYARQEFDVDRDDWAEHYAVGLSQVLHAHHLELGALREEVSRTRPRVVELEQLAAITQVAAWLRQIEVPERLLVSVVMPTHNRAALMERAVASVIDQTYGNWELLVVDDASTDETWARLEKLAAHEPRLRAIRLATAAGSSGARNIALEQAHGDVITYLDDDNRFDHEWLRAVAWAFGEYPDVQVAYGARVIDDDVRHQGLPGRSLPIVQLLPWDRDVILERNLVDQNAIAHRPAPARFDPELDHYTDWDLLLQLTDDCDPLPLPALAVHYHSDATDRLSNAYSDHAFVAATMDRIRTRTLERRGRA